MSDCLTLYLLDHKACIAGAESTEIPDTNMMSGANKHIFSLHACHRPTTLECTTCELWLLISYTMFMLLASGKCTVAAAGNLSL